MGCISIYIIKYVFPFTNNCILYGFKSILFSLIFNVSKPSKNSTTRFLASLIPKYGIPEKISPQPCFCSMNKPEKITCNIVFDYYRLFVPKVVEYAEMILKRVEPFFISCCTSIMNIHIFWLRTLISNRIIITIIYSNKSWIPCFHFCRSIYSYNFITIRYFQVCP